MFIEEAERKLDHKFKNSHKSYTTDLRILTESFKSYFGSKEPNLKRGSKPEKYVI